jgi:NAD(P)-dependent dehydrogenase (short-subunit alcohol dehydrogenase family)
LHALASCEINSSMSLNPRIRNWRGQRVWLIGASSGIGRATAQALHARGAHVIVSARNIDALQSLATECAGLQTLRLDVTDAQAVRTAGQHLLASGTLDLVVYCAGHYSAMRAQELDMQELDKHLNVNYRGALHVIDAVLPSLLRAGRGHLSVVSSVAGYRGLPQSLAYGPTKAALINLAETLYLDLHDAGVGVSVINPGFVETPLTAQNTFSMPALITPAQAAIEIIAGWDNGEFEIHFPKRFTRWMRMLRVLPYTAYFKVTRRFTGL